MTGPVRAGATCSSAAVLAALPFAVLTLNQDNRLQLANSGAEAMFGLSQAQLIQNDLVELVGAGCVLFAMVDQARNRMMTVSNHDLCVQGSRFQQTGLLAQVTPIPESPGCVLVSLQDGRASRALDRQEAFRGLARSVGGFAAMLAHEVRNPLSGIRGAAQLLERNLRPADRDLALLIRDEADRIRALVDRMEMFGDRPPALDSVNIHRVLDHVRRLAATGFASGIRFNECYDPSLPPVRGSRDQLVQVMLNLVKNAAEALASQPGAEITLSTSYQSGIRLADAGQSRRLDVPLVVAVRDNGPGMSDAARHEVFKPFVTTKPGGSGLGLALVAKIVDDHDGTIEVESRAGHTEFRIRLPVFVDEEGVIA